MSCFDNQYHPIGTDKNRETDCNLQGSQWFRLDLLGKVPETSQTGAKYLDNFTISAGRDGGALPYGTDPGISGGKDLIAQSARNEAMMQQYIMQGMGYSDARAKLGLPRDMDTGMSGGEKAKEDSIRQEAQYEANLRNGMHYQEARRAAGMSRDMDPGMSGGTDAIERRDRQHAWRNEYLRQGESYEDASTHSHNK